MTQTPALAARRWGRGPEPLVLLHGFTGSGAAFDHLEDLLGDLVSASAPDLPGHGGSPVPAVTPGRDSFSAAADEVAVTIATSFKAKVHLAGYSMGARLALAVALEHPELVRSLVLESGGAGLASPSVREERRTADEELARTLEREGLRAFLAKWEETPVLAELKRLAPELQQKLRARRLGNAAAGLAWALRHLGQGSQPSYWPRLSELRVPVLLLHGARDEKYAALAGRLAGLISGARLEAIAGAGHTPHLERPAEYAGALRAHLGRVVIEPSKAVPTSLPTPGSQP